MEIHFPHETDDVKLLADGVESARELITMFRNARQFVFYSSFICDLSVPLLGTVNTRSEQMNDQPWTSAGSITMLDLFRELEQRGVQMFILYNPELAYNKLPLTDFIAQLPSSARVRSVAGSGSLPKITNFIVDHTHFSTHHQQYLCVDGERLMVGGTDVDVHHTGWLQFNTCSPVEYSWHETSVSVSCTPAMLRFIKSNYDNIQDTAPFPLVCGGDQEHRLLCHMIESARSCIHMESNWCTSAAGTSNAVFKCIADRVYAAYLISTNSISMSQDRFHFFLLTNLFQRDEPDIVSKTSTQQLYWSIRYLYNQMSMLGVSPAFIAQRVFVGRMVEPDFSPSPHSVLGGRHIKVHANMVIQDGHTLLRSSSTVTDRSLSTLPCATELGIMIRSDQVALLQQKLWRRYFMIADDSTHIVFTPEDALVNMANEQGVVRRVVTSFNAKTKVVDKVADAVVSVLHQLEFCGNKRKIHWKLTSE